MAEQTLTLLRTLELAQGLEVAAKNVKEQAKGAHPESSSLPSASSGDVHHVASTPYGKGSKKKFKGACF